MGGLQNFQPKDTMGARSLHGLAGRLESFMQERVTGAYWIARNHIQLWQSLRWKQLEAVGEPEENKHVSLP